MGGMKDLFQEGDWSKEKHVPVIEIESECKSGEEIVVKVTVGKQLPHPNTTEHHISWIAVYFKPQGDKFPYELGRFEFLSHGSSVQGANTSGVYSSPSVTLSFQTNKAGTLYATSYCNIHGLWENSVQITLG